MMFASLSAMSYFVYQIPWWAVVAAMGVFACAVIGLIVGLVVVFNRKPRA